MIVFPSYEHFLNLKNILQLMKKHKHRFGIRTEDLFRLLPIKGTFFGHRTMKYSNILKHNK